MTGTACWANRLGTRVGMDCGERGMQGLWPAFAAHPAQEALEMPRDTEDLRPAPGLSLVISLLYIWIHHYE